MVCKETTILQMNLYLLVNRGIYSIDKAKIIFVLSYITDKEVGRCSTYITSIMDQTTGNIMLPTYGTFMIIFKDAFKPTDKTGEAMSKLHTQHMCRSFSSL